MKKFLFYFVFIALGFFILEVISYNFLYGFYNNGVDCDDKKWFSIKKPNLLEYDYVMLERTDKTIPYDENKRPVLTMGCSYAYGQGIKINRIFSSQLQKTNKRKTTNIAFWGEGPDFVMRSIAYMHKLNMLKDNNFEYVIYVQMYDHIERLEEIALLGDYLSTVYKKNKERSLYDRLKYYLDYSYTIKLINSKRLWKREDIHFDFLKYEIEKMYVILSGDLPDVNFVVLLYDDITNCGDTSPVNGNYENRFKALQPDSYSDLAKKYGDKIKFISTKELTGDVLWKKQYQLYDDVFQSEPPHHPNEKAWELVVPALNKKLSL